MATATPNSFRPSFQITLRRVFGLPLYSLILKFVPEQLLSSLQMFCPDGYNQKLEAVFS
jgi:hypothetical protein